MGIYIALGCLAGSLPGLAFLLGAYLASGEEAAEDLLDH